MVQLNSATSHRSDPVQRLTLPSRVFCTEFSPFPWSSSLLAVGLQSSVTIGQCRFTEEDSSISDFQWEVMKEIHHDTRVQAMAWSPKLPHRHILDHFFGKIRESGQLSRILRANIPTTNKADCWGEGEFRSSLLNLSLYGLIFFRSMGLENTIAAFGLITAASIAAILIFLFELGVSWFRGKQ